MFSIGARFSDTKRETSCRELAIDNNRKVKRTAHQIHIYNLLVVNKCAVPAQSNPAPVCRSNANLNQQQ